MFTILPKSDVLPKIFVKMTQKIQILLDTFNKSALRIILSACLHAVVCGYKTGRGWVHAVVCGNKIGRETKNALYLNEILHRKPRGFPLVRGRVLYKQTITNLTEMRAFYGMANQLTPFNGNLSKALSPLRPLLKKEC